MKTRYRRDIPEGAAYSELPQRFGWGRILTADYLHERYITLRLFGWRVFIVRCNSEVYGESFRYWRGWVRRSL